MAWKVIVAETALQRLRAKFPPLDVAFVEHLQALESNPDIAQPVSEGPLAGRRSYQFRLARPPATLQLTAFLNIDEERKEIQISTFGVMKGNPPEIVELFDDGDGTEDSLVHGP